MRRKRRVLPTLFSSSAFKPTDLSGCELWLDASDTSTITEASGSVSQWDDKSGNDNHATQSIATNQPTTGIRTINSLNVLDFNGSDDSMTLPSTLYTIPNSENTVFIVNKKDQATKDQRLLTGAIDTSSRWGLFYNKYSDSSFDVINNTSYTLLPLSIIEDQVEHINVLRRFSSELQGYRDGGTGSSGTDVANVTVDNIRIGRSGGGLGLDFLDGVIGEILIYSRALSDLEINKIGQYLADKWSISWSEI